MQLLGHDALEGDRQLHAHLVLLVGREDVDDAVDRLRRALRVQRGEDEVAGLGRGQRGRDRLEVAHLADEDHVRVLAQRGLEGEREGLGVGAELALVDDALLCEWRNSIGSSTVMMCSSRVLVDRVDHRRERGGLAGAGRARDEDEAARLLDEVVRRGRQAEVVDRLDRRRDQAERGADRGALEVGVDAEARVAGDRVGEVELPLVLELLALVVGEDRVDDLARVGGRQLADSPRAARGGRGRGPSAARRRSGEGRTRCGR